MTTRSPSLRLTPDPRSARQARQHARTALATAGHQEWADDAALAVTELVTNVIRHARTDCEVCVCISPDAARISVRDYDPTPPIHRHPGPLATTGRGIPLVAELSNDFGITPLGADGKVVWFSFRQPRRAGNPQADTEPTH